MAIVGKLTHLDWFFKSNPYLEEIQTYMLHALNPTHSIHKRITGLSLALNEERKEVSYPFNWGIRAIEQTYYLKSQSKAFFETHRVFIDFQLVVEGYEYTLIGDKSAFEVKMPYDESKDLIVYENHLPHSSVVDRKSSNLNGNLLNDSFPMNKRYNTPYRTSLLLSSGDLAIFFPEDVHAGGLELHTQNTQARAKQVKKSVIKVPLSLIRP
ncbi:YhcH/YjgK/YiaL family protein [Helicobacter marmotae]|uniref:DUF386 domain-containing protein n=1 Tax=Helicobacter marmotae TaxID=152490 RepID=A0A3D8I605_9HELI|nr:YhcH/YjgK/YiaL family protein [Helicobacter marmotae]RDU59991.1 DUF386 domain-containing protein [Helicobacter marmotae]